MEIDAFEKVVVVVAMLVLIVTLIIMATAIQKKNPNTVKAASCPDFWLSSYFTPCHYLGGCCPDGVTPSNAGNEFCKNIAPAPYGKCDDGYTPKDATGGGCPVAAPMCYNNKNLGKKNATSNLPEGECAKNNFETVDYKGSLGMCKKQKFAERCQVSWEGVSNQPITSGC